MTAPFATRTATTAPALGLPMGTRVMTLDGALPVEHLTPGDRVVTRDGVRRLTAVTVTVARDAAMVAVAPGALGHDRPDRALLLPAAQPVLLRDWRAQAMYGAPAVLVPVGRLADGTCIVDRTVPEVRLFALHFHAPAVVHADGVEVGCAPLTVDA
jgi:hypothetical protein